MAVSAPSGGTTTYKPTTEKLDVNAGKNSGNYTARYSTTGDNQGGSRPDDFGHGSPDYNHDGKIDDAEARAWQTKCDSDDRRYETDQRLKEEHYESDQRLKEEHFEAESRERIAMEHEKGLNYRAELQAQTAAMQSNNDNKIHKMFGFNLNPTATATPPAKVN